MHTGRGTRDGGAVTDPVGHRAPVSPASPVPPVRMRFLLGAQLPRVSCLLLRIRPRRHRRTRSRPRRTTSCHCRRSGRRTNRRRATNRRRTTPSRCRRCRPCRSRPTSCCHRRCCCGCRPTTMRPWPPPRPAGRTVRRRMARADGDERPDKDEADDRQDDADDHGVTLLPIPPKRPPWAPRLVRAVEMPLCLPAQSRVEEPQRVLSGQRPLTCTEGQVRGRPCLTGPSVGRDLPGGRAETPCRWRGGHAADCRASGGRTPAASTRGRRVPCTR